MPVSQYLRYAWLPLRGATASGGLRSRKPLSNPVECYQILSEDPVATTTTNANMQTSANTDRNVTMNGNGNASASVTMCASHGTHSNTETKAFPWQVASCCVVRRRQVQGNNPNPKPWWSASPYPCSYSSSSSCASMASSSAYKQTTRIVSPLKT